MPNFHNNPANNDHPGARVTGEEAQSFDVYIGFAFAFDFVRCYYRFDYSNIPELIPIKNCPFQYQSATLHDLHSQHLLHCNSLDKSDILRMKCHHYWVLCP